jgi:endonuclease/exonuclease/phosphatase family metal-dependent hydrolase
MKYTSILLLFQVLLAAFPLGIHSQVNVVTYNIRYNNPGDGEHAWPNRKDDVINLLRFHQADIFCLQEALEGQVKEVDAACIRICSWVKLEERSTGRELMVFNTHFDHVGTLARKNAADLVIQKIGKMKGDSPVILCGDFNLPPESAPIEKIAANLNDAYRVTELPPHGATGTWSGFTYEDEQGDRIDYIFVSDDLRVKRYAALTDSRDGSFFSDHLPVFVEVDWR